jgi:hypothetical protein
MVALLQPPWKQLLEDINAIEVHEGPKALWYPAASFHGTHVSSSLKYRIEIRIYSLFVSGVLSFIIMKMIPALGLKEAGLSIGQ